MQHHKRGGHEEDGDHHESLTGRENPWRHAEHAQAWLERSQEAGRDRGAELETFAALLPIADDAPARALELGAGAGGLTRVLLERFPRLQVLALDLSPVMIAEGRRRLAVYGERVDFVSWDLEQDGWPGEAAGPFDLVVSSLAIHHLMRSRKASLARQVFLSLRPGGTFLDIDYLESPSPSTRAQYEQAHRRMTGGAEEGGGHHATGGHATGTLMDYFEDMRAAGFVDLDVPWKQLALAIVCGRKPGA